jgi:hypothetical protein
MSGAPQFPTPDWYGAQPLRPGGSAHKAGLSLEQRIEALERGALGRPGPGVTDGSIVVADSTAQGNAVWVDPGYQVISERAARVTSGIGTTSFGIGQDGLLYFGATAGVTRCYVYIDPAAWGTDGVTVKMRGWAQTETNPTDSTLTLTLFRITAAGAGGTISTSSQVAGIDCTCAPNLATTLYTTDESEAVTITTAGQYLVNFAHNNNPGQAMSYGYTLMGKRA